jgi:hypothetical protein
MAGSESSLDLLGAYDLVINLSEKLDPSFDRTTLSSASHLQAQLRIIGQKLQQDTSQEKPSLTEKYERVSRFIADNPQLFPQKAQHEGLLTKALKGGIRLAGRLALTSQDKLKEAADRACTELQTANVDPAALESLSVTANRLPAFLLQLLQFYRDNPQYQPPGALQSLFTYKQEESKWELSFRGIAVMSFLSQQKEWTASFFQTNLLCLLNSVRKALTDPQKLPANLFTGSARDRARAITDFIFKNSEIVPPSGIFSVFSGLLRGLVQRQIQSLLGSSKEGPESPISEPEELTAPPPKKHLPPEIPLDQVQRFAEFQDLAEALGGTLLGNIPEFALLRPLRDRPRPEQLGGALQRQPMSLLEAMGKVFSPIATALTKKEGIQNEIEQQRKALTDKGYLSQTSVEYPRKCIDAIFTMIKEGLKDPSKVNLPALYPLIEGEPPRLNDRGLAVQALLSDDNIENIACLVELNILHMLSHSIETIEEKQKDNPAYLLDTIFPIVESMQLAIQKAGGPEDTADKWDISENAKKVSEALLATVGNFVLPDAFAGKIDPKTIVPEGVRRGAGLLEKHFDKVVSGITTFILREALKRSVSTSKKEGPAPEPTSKKENPTPEPAKPEQKPPVPPLEPPQGFEYTKKKELEQKIAGLFPGLRLIGKKIAQAASKLFPYGAIKVHFFLDRALSSAPAPEKVAKELLTLPKAFLKKPTPKPEVVQPKEPKLSEEPKKESRAAAKKPEPISPKTIIRDVLSSFKEKIEKDFRDIRFRKHPFKTIKLGLEKIGLALAVWIVPNVAPSIIGLRTHKEMIEYIHNVVRGGLHGGAEGETEDIPPIPPQPHSVENP